MRRAVMVVTVFDRNSAALFEVVARCCPCPDAVLVHYDVSLRAADGYILSYLGDGEAQFVNVRQANELQSERD